MAVERCGPEIFGNIYLVSFMISRPNLGSSHWLGFVPTECCLMTSSYNVTS